MADRKLILITGASSGLGNLAARPSRWIFFINLPIGIAVVALAFVLIPDVKPGGRHRLDIVGVLLASLALLAICYGLVEGQKYNWGKITGFISVPVVIGAGVVLLAIFLVVQALSQGREPLVPFALIRERNFSLMNFVTCAVSIGMMGILLPFTIYLQSVLGMTALHAGLTLAPDDGDDGAACADGGPDGRQDRRQIHPDHRLTLFAGGMGWMVAVAATGNRWYDFLPALIVAGAGGGCLFAPRTTMAMRNVQPQPTGAASGMLNTNRQVGSVIGTAAVGAPSGLASIILENIRSNARAFHMQTTAISGFQLTGSRPIPRNRVTTSPLRSAATSWRYGSSRS